MSNDRLNFSIHQAQLRSSQRSVTNPVTGKDYGLGVTDPVTDDGARKLLRNWVRNLAVCQRPSHFAAPALTSSTISRHALRSTLSTTRLHLTFYLAPSNKLVPRAVRKKTLTLYLAPEQFFVCSATSYKVIP